MISDINLLQFKMTFAFCKVFDKHIHIPHIFFGVKLQIFNFIFIIDSCNKFN